MTFVSFVVSSQRLYRLTRSYEHNQSSISWLLVPEKMGGSLWRGVGIAGDVTGRDVVPSPWSAGGGGVVSSEDALVWAAGVDGIGGSSLPDRSFVVMASGYDMASN